MDITNRFAKRRISTVFGTIGYGKTVILIFAVFLVFAWGTACGERGSTSPPGPDLTASREMNDVLSPIDMNQSKYVPAGQWGGIGIRLNVGEKNTIIEYACADGEIVGRMKLDNKGHFTAAGTHSRIRPGPVREGEKPQSRPARFEGKVSASNMTLKVTLTDTDEEIGNFELKKNGGARLHRCL